MYTIFLPKSEIFQKTIEFADSTLVLLDKSSEKGKNNPYISHLREAAIAIFLYLIKGINSVYSGNRRKCFIIANQRCLQCLVLLSILRHKGSIGVLLYAALKAKVEHIDHMLTKMINRVEQNCQF